MIDALIKELDTEMTEAETNEKLNQEDYEELMATVEYIGQLHGECDWLIKYFDVRKEARTGEIEVLGKAKAVLNGADYSLMQTKSHTFLRRA